MVEKNAVATAPIQQKKRVIGRPFKPGQSGNPKGRPQNSRNKLGEAFLDALRDDFLEHGVDAIQKVRTEDTTQYVKVIASILPKDMNLNVNQNSELTDDELIKRIRDLNAVIEPFIAAERASGTSRGTEKAAKRTEH